MNVLSLFDGMSCGQQALERVGIKVDNYFASEIDKHAIKVTMANYPNTVQLGSVVDVNVKSLLLSEVYSYLCENYFTNDIQSLQSIIPKRELLHRINQEQRFAAFFGTQVQNEEFEASKHSTVSINDKIWFFRNPMDNHGGVYHVIRGGERRAKPNRLDFNSMLEHSFWWNGGRQQEPIIKRESVEGSFRKSAVGENKSKAKGSGNKTISIEGSEGASKEESLGAILKSANEGELFERDSKSGHCGKVEKEERNRRKEEACNVSSTERELSGRYDHAGIEQSDSDFVQLYKNIQITLVECEWGIIIFKGDIKMTFGGSPCQSFSFAGKRKGMSTKDEQEILTLEHYLKLKSEGFEFEGQSYLFWEYMRILTHLRECNPGVKFLLENVMMGEKWEKVLSRAIGVNPIEINSSLVSAQNRRRLYWTNIGMQPAGLFGDMASIIKQPKDKGILLKDILETDVDEKYFLKNSISDRISGAYNVTKQGKVVNEFIDKSHALMARDYKGFGNQGMTGIIVHNTMPRSSKTGKGGTGPLSRNDGETYCLDTGSTNAIEINGYGNKRLNETIKNNELIDGCLIDSYNKTIHTDKSITISTRIRNSNATHLFTNSRIRRLTPIECERLQTVKDNFTNYVSDSQRYKMLGNGWTVDVIAHIFSYLK